MSDLTPSPATNGADVNRIDCLGVREGRHVNIGNTPVSALRGSLRLFCLGDLICSAEGLVRPKEVVLDLNITRLS